MQAKNRPIGTDTIITHSGSDPSSHHGFVNTPVYRGSTVVFPNVETMNSGGQNYQYGRWGNPTTEALTEAITALEGAAGTVLCPSGLSACTTAILSAVSAGGHLLMADNVYGPARHFCDTAAARFGIETTYFDPKLGSEVATLIRPNTMAIYVESPGSHTFELTDIPAIAEVAQRHDLLVIADNTWATPVNFKPLAFGADLSVMAATKYVVGHSDALIGTVAASHRAWERLRAFHFQMGLYVGPDDVALTLRGLRTMAVRLERHQKNATRIAHWLEGREEVESVLYPALLSHPDHSLWLRDFRGASGLLSFVTKPAPEAAVRSLLDGLEYFSIGYSWGGYESLAMTVDPRKMRSATKWEKPGHLVRLHIGLEDPDDLMADLAEGLDRFHARVHE